jgi:hypothetical protein
MRIPALSLAALAALASAAIAQPRLSLPVDCTPGETCWIANYVDNDPGADARDYRCGALTYDGHSGTDFAMRDEATVMAVVAAAPGTVTAARDAMPDTGLGNGRDAVAGRECGNGVVIAHGDGWETQYCHMRRGSVAVQPGERVERGTKLGLIGLSGATEFPHLHLSLRQAGKTVDPFLGEAPPEACGAGARSLWDETAAAALAYRPIAIYNAGFSGGRPDSARIRRGEPDPAVTRQAGALVLWADIFGINAGDRISLRIVGPDGTVVIENAVTADRRQARRFQFAGERAPPGAWPAGRYTGEITVARGNDLSVRRAATIELR